MQDCVAGLPGPFHLERGTSLVSCSFHTSGPRVAVPALCKCPTHPPVSLCRPQTPSTRDSCIPEASRTSGSFSEEPPLILFIRRIPVGASLRGLIEMWEQQASAHSFRCPPPTHVPQPLGECATFCPEDRCVGDAWLPRGLFLSFRSHSRLLLFLIPASDVWMERHGLALRGVVCGQWHELAVLSSCIS